MIPMTAKTSTAIVDDEDLTASAPTVVKQSYTIPCSSAFRDAVETLAATRQVNVGDIARSVLLMLPWGVIDGYADPGEPQPGDRELVILKSGPAKGRPWRRKPRLQVRMAPGYSPAAIRKALGVALALAGEQVTVRLEAPSAPKAAAPEPPPVAAPPQDHPQMDAIREELARMRAAIAVLAFDPLPAGVNSRAEALYVLGFPPGTWPDAREIRGRFRMLATVHHPDSRFGDHARMSQLNQAMEFLRGGS